MRNKSMNEPNTIARPDERGRITLGQNLTKDVSRFDVYVDNESGEIILRPYYEIPAKEAWLYKNNTAHELVEKGIKAAKSKKYSEVKFKSKNWIEDVRDEE